MAEDNDITQTQEGDSELVRKLRQEIAARNEQLQEQASTVEELSSKVGEFEVQQKTATKAQLFADLNVNVESGPGKLLFESYDGELNDESVRAFAETYDLLPENTPTPAQEAEADAHDVINRAAAGAGAAPVTPESSSQEGLEAGREEFLKTGSRDRAMATAFDKALQAESKKIKAARG